MNKILHRCEVEEIHILRNKCLNILLFADDQLIMSYLKNELQKLNKLISENEMTQQKIKNMAFCGQEARSIIII
jgi:hypothetical protein